MAHRKPSVPPGGARPYRRGARRVRLCWCARVHPVWRSHKHAPRARFSARNACAAFFAGPDGRGEALLRWDGQRATVPAGGAAALDVVWAAVGYRYSTAPICEILGAAGAPGCREAHMGRALCCCTRPRHTAASGAQRRPRRQRRPRGRRCLRAAQFNAVGARARMGLTARRIP